MNKPLVSIGMPVYNGQNTLRSALDCILNQDFKDYELIISDNCSSDETEAICLHYASLNKNIYYIKQNTNQGAFKNFEYVLGKARGKFFMWAAHDDEWKSNFLSKCLEVFKNNDGCVTVLSHINVVNYNNREVIKKIYPSSRSSEIDYVRTLRSCQEIVSNLIYGLHKTEVIRKIKIENYDWFDVYLTIELSLYGQVLIIPEFLYQVGINGNTRPAPSLTGKYMDFKTFRKRIWRLLRNKFTLRRRLLLLLRLYYISYLGEKKFNSEIRRNSL